MHAAASVRRRPKDIWSSRLKKNCRRGDALLRPRRRLSCAAASTYTMATACAAAASGTVAARGCRLCHQPLLSLWYTLRGCSVQCFTFSYSPGGCGSWGSSLASVLQGAVAGEGAAAIEVLLTSEEATQPYMRYLLRQKKKKGKKEIHALLVQAPLLYLLAF